MLPEDLPDATNAVAADVLLAFQMLRSHWIVARALAEQFPTENAWVEFQQSVEFHEAVNSLSPFIADVRQAESAAIGEGDWSRIAELGDRYYNGAIEQIEALATRLQIHPADLLSVLMEA
jgi:hypothetical protein